MASSGRLQAYTIRKQIGKGSYGQVFLVTVKDERKKVGVDCMTFCNLHTHIRAVCDEKH